MDLTERVSRWNKQCYNTYQPLLTRQLRQQLPTTTVNARLQLKQAGALVNCRTPQLSKLSSQAIAAGSPRGQTDRNKLDYSKLSKLLGYTNVHS